MNYAPMSVDVNNLKTIPLVETITVDYPVWNAPDINKEAYDKGVCPISKLIDKITGKMCCLGFAVVQSGVPEEIAIGEMDPKFLILKGYAVQGLVKIRASLGDTTGLADTAMGINDDRNLSPENKIDQLYARFSKDNYRIVFKNVPKEISDKVNYKDAIVNAVVE